MVTQIGYNIGVVVDLILLPNRMSFSAINQMIRKAVTELFLIRDCGDPIK